MGGTLFPSDLLEAQTDWHATHERRAASPPDGGAAHRGRLVHLSRLFEGATPLSRGYRPGDLSAFERCRNLPVARSLQEWRLPQGTRTVG